MTHKALVVPAYGNTYRKCSQSRYLGPGAWGLRMFVQAPLSPLPVELCAQARRAGAITCWRLLMMMSAPRQRSVSTTHVPWFGSSTYPVASHQSGTHVLRTPLRNEVGGTPENCAHAALHAGALARWCRINRLAVAAGTDGRPSQQQYLPTLGRYLGKVGTYI